MQLLLKLMTLLAKTTKKCSRRVTSRGIINSSAHVVRRWDSTMLNIVIPGLVSSTISTKELSMVQTLHAGAA
jgi:uncharacterized paraquat-inducible protein A